MYFLHINCITRTIKAAVTEITSAFIVLKVYHGLVLLFYRHLSESILARTKLLTYAKLFHA
ncbi:hypothetical protein SpAn4DRAFT_4401 [Sporomusa ovata]|uniref:Uncharacterized protein n=1 Tax=Sporomusa ovata TaxID=2378 RepID=A0A0U1L5S6_9FIRM|nr:hypothetical protein SpAn4DRAFT_4401 [Sporomusa ovata]